MQAALEEMLHAEDNFDAILDLGDQVASHTLLGSLTGRKEVMGDLEDVIGDIKTVFAFLRRDLQAKAASVGESLDFGIKKPAKPGDVLSPGLMERHRNICPLTVFLQSIADLLIKFRINAQEAGGQVWGSIYPLQRLLVRLEGSLRISSTRWFGLASCIMFHEEFSQFGVTSSAACYRSLRGMDRFGIQHRTARHDAIKACGSGDAKSRIETAERLSATLFHQINSAQVSSDALKYPSKNDIKREAIGGLAAQFDPCGVYKVACALDDLRFGIRRPLRAVNQEGQVVERFDKEKDIGSGIALQYLGGLVGVLATGGLVEL